MAFWELEYVSPFSSELCPEGFVCVTGNTLRIIALEKLGETFNQQVVPLRYTPRKLLINPHTSNLIILESDHHT
ncbi:hypothetical protein, partial [Streptococcus pneumoniae]|uniref:hypothetical protein n=1 Tax=Streptococcus pneumoniae TaxID=1313 RepID=UPI001E48E5BE